jgi:hypothetical protein
MTLAFHLKLAGVTLLLLAVLNVYIIKRFGWRDELRRVSLLTRQVFFAHLAFIVLTLVGMGVLALCFTPAVLAPSPLARLVLAALALFWGVRLAFQWLFYHRSLWRGHRFETVVHYLFTGLWSYYTAVFAWAWWHALV